MRPCIIFCQRGLRGDSEGSGKEAATAPQGSVLKRPSRPKPQSVTQTTERRGPSPLVNSVVEVTSQFERTQEITPPLRSDTETQSQLLREALQLQDWTCVVLTANNILASDTRIDAPLLDDVFQGLCSGGQFRDAIQLYDKLLDRRYCLSLRTFRVCIQTALKDGAYHLGRKLYKDMRASGHRLYSVMATMMINGFLRDKRKGSQSPSVAYEIWKEIEKSKDIDGALYRAGCGACVAVGKMDEATRLIGVMRQNGFRPDQRFYNRLIQGYCRVQDMKHAFQTLEEMKTAGISPGRVTYNTLIQGFVRKQQMDGAEKTLKYAIQEGCRPDVWTYTSLMKGYLKNGQGDEVDRLFTEMRSHGVKPNHVTFSILIDRHVENGRMDVAQERFNTMIELGLHPNVVIYNTLLKGYASTGSKEDIIHLLIQMQQRRLYPGEDTLNTLLSTMMSSENSQAVQEVFDQMTKLGLAPDGVSYTYLLRAAHREGDVDRCRRIFQEIQSSSTVEMDLVCWNVMVDIFSDSGEIQEAETALQGAVHCAQDRRLSIPVEAFGAILKAYIRSNNLPAAIEKFRWFCQLGGQPDAGMLTLLLETCIVRHDLHHAYKILRMTQLLHQEIDLSRYRRLLMKLERDYKHWYDEDRKMNSGVERLKFWLGIPNDYYSSNWP